MRGMRVVLLIDAEAVLASIVRGYSARCDIGGVVGAIWQQIHGAQCLANFCRVSTDANLADGPSRGRFELAQQCGWQRRRLDRQDFITMGLGCLDLAGI